MFVGIFVAILVIIFTTLMVWWNYVMHKKYKSLANVPGPKPIPLLGNISEMGSNSVELLNNFIKLNNEYGPLVKLIIGSTVRLLVTKPQYVEYFLSSNTHITKSKGYNFVKPWIGEGLLISTGSKWKIHRKLLTTVFHFNILEEFVNTFESAGNILIDNLRKETNKESTDIYPYINYFALDVIAETVMGKSIYSQQNSNYDYVNAVHGFLETFTGRFFSLWYQNDFLFNISKLCQQQKKYIKTLHAFTWNVIKRRKEEITKYHSDFYEGAEEIKPSAALVDRLIEIEEMSYLMNEADIRQQIDTFTYAGHDTVSSAVSLTLYALAQNPKVQEKVFEEVINLLGDGNTSITFADLREMKYLERVIKETQRLYPSVPMIERQLTEECVLDGYKIPKGTIIGIFIYGMHRSPETFPRPDEFDPDRFLPENSTGRHPYAYIPFSAGPRNCIGQKFAMLEMKCTIAKVIRNFKLEPLPGFKVTLGANAVLKGIGGIKFKLTNRQF